MTTVHGVGGSAAKQVPVAAVGVAGSYLLNSSCVKVGEIELIAPASTPGPPSAGLSRYAM